MDFVGTRRQMEDYVMSSLGIPDWAFCGEDKPMTTEEAFLVDIIASPKDDTPRLIYADWLEEHGQGERGEFIRVQIELAKLDPPRKRYTIVDTFTSRRGKGTCCVEGDPVEVGDRVDLVLPVEERHGLYKEKWHGVLVTSLHGPGARYGDRTRRGFDFLVDEHSRPWPGEVLRQREEELAAAHAQSWLWKELGDEVVECSWRRGFVHAVSLKWVNWCGAECRCFSERRHLCRICDGAGRMPAHGPALVKATPLERVTLTDREPRNFPSGSDDRDEVWWWDEEGYDGHGMEQASVLPSCVFRLIPNPHGEHHLGWMTREEGALFNSSKALIAWAKHISSAK